MMMPDFRDFQGRGEYVLEHSAKGTTWKKHKYIRKDGGRYIYAKTGTVSSKIAKAARGTMLDAGFTVGVSSFMKEQELGQDLKKKQEAYELAKAYADNAKGSKDIKKTVQYIADADNAKKAYEEAREKYYNMLETKTRTAQKMEEEKEQKRKENSKKIPSGRSKKTSRW